MAQTTRSTGSLFADAVRAARENPGQRIQISTPFPTMSACDTKFTQPPVKIPEPVSASRDKTTVKYALRSMVQGDYMLFSKVSLYVYSKWVPSAQSASLFNSASEALHALTAWASDNQESLASLNLVKVTLTYRVTETVADL